MNKRFKKEVNSVNYKVTGRILTANQNLLNNFNKIKSLYISPFLVQNEILYIYLVRISLNSTGNKPTAAALVGRWKQAILSE
mmetsp:Transcript_26929/g.46949  ORF Transcript_26929/g.46949 Transcript_26929/m.46949 type:complete len:82 (-) Transcript_26929:608-853(-)